ncbi:MAG: IgA-specific serine endopeptidase autotransporter precursor, partial [Pseudomonadota bacterium]
SAPAASSPAGPPTRPPRAGGRTRAIVLAFAMHALLIGLLVFGLQWTHREPEPVQAELWVPPPPKAPKPEPSPAPRVEPKPEPSPPPPVAKPEPPPPLPKADPDIKAEQAKKEAERKEAERRLAEQKAAQSARTARAEAERKEEQRKEAEKKAEERKAAERRLAEQKAAEQKAADDKRRAEQARKDAELAEQRRAEDIRRLQNQAGTQGVPSEQAVRGAAAGRVDAGYGARVGAAIRSNTTFQIPADLDGNPKAVFLVQLRGDCSVAAVRLRKPSGVAAWDQAAERGIQRTDPFPRPAEGNCPAELEISRGPRDER